jgi:branched-chain amino acid transport system substrate-binding protein
MCRSVRLVVVGLLLGLLVSCDKPQPIKIGFVAGQSGRVADLGVAGRNGVLLAVEEINAAGGINGRLVELIVRDDEQKPEAARHAMAELLAQKVEVIIGPMTSSMAMVLVPLANAARVPLVSPTVTTTDLSGRDDYFLRIISSTAEYAAKNAQYQYRLGHRRVAAIYDMGNRAYTESWINHFRTSFELQGGEVVAVETFTSGVTPSFQEPCRKVLASKPDTVQIAANAVDAALIAQQLRKLDPKVNLGFVEWAATERLLELGGVAVDGAVVDQYVDRDSTAPAYRKFLADYRERFKLEPGFAGVASYDTARIVFAALAKREKGVGLREAIVGGGPYQGLQQQIILDRFGDANRPTMLSVIRQGQFVIVE